MSVIRRPGVLGQTTRRRIVGVTGALSTAAVEMLAVGTWFALVVVHGRTLLSALAGLAILLGGALFRAGVYRAVTDSRGSLRRPDRVATTMSLAACWLTWLLVAEAVGGAEGALAGGAVLAGCLSLQFFAERCAFEVAGDRSPAAAVVAPTIIAVGATAMLVAAWHVDWTLVNTSFSFADRTLVVDVGAFAIGFACFGLCSFVGHQRRLERALCG